MRNERMGFEEGNVSTREERGSSGGGFSPTIFAITSFWECIGSKNRIGV
jgi:hypothetical protein